MPRLCRVPTSTPKRWSLTLMPSAARHLPLSKILLCITKVRRGKRADNYQKSSCIRQDPLVPMA